MQSLSHLIVVFTLSSIAQLSHIAFNVRLVMLIGKTVNFG